MTFDPLKDIVDFHEKFGLTYSGPPRALPEALADFRKKFMQEELDEYGLAQSQAYAETTMDFNNRDPAEYSFQLENTLDALVDEMYVLLGTAYLHGFNNFGESWRRVHEANMKKVRALKSNQRSGRDPEYDVVKPEGWEPPTHTDLVEINDLFEPHEDRS